MVWCGVGVGIDNQLIISPSPSATLGPVQNSGELAQRWSWLNCDNGRDQVCTAGLVAGAALSPRLSSLSLPPLLHQDFLQGQGVWEACSKRVIGLSKLTDTGHLGKFLSATLARTPDLISLAY